MFGMGWPELAVCALVGFFVFGPERLPGVARDAARALTKLRTMAQGVTDELKEQLPERESLGLAEFRELGDLRDLHPRRIVRSALFDNDRELQAKVSAAESGPDPIDASAPPVGVPVAATAVPVARTLAPSLGASPVPAYDIDAT